MPLKNFIKENFVLAVGLTLPVLLVALFFAASVLPKSMAVPPQYEMLFTETRYDSQGQSSYNVDFFVKEGTIKARVWKLPQAGTVPRKKLMAFDAKTQSVRELPYDLSKIGNVPDQTEIAFDEFKSLKVEGSNKAPDGYEFEGGGYGSGGIVTELFGGGYHGRTARVVKDGAVFKIPNNGNDYYGDTIQFLGWVIQK